MISTPHVLVDATAIPANRGGVGRYLEYLVPALAAAGTQLTVLTTERDAEWMSRAAPTAAIIPIAGASGFRGGRLLWEQLRLPGLARRLGVDVVFSPHYTMPVLCPVPVVVTLHDATFFSLPKLHGRVKRIFFRVWSRYSLRHAALCVVPSEATRRELVSFAGGQANRIRVAYHGVDPTRFYPPTGAQIEAAASVLGTPEWITFLGTLEPRKNIANLVRAFTTVAEHRPGMVLALAGGSGWDDELSGVIGASAARDRIRKLGFVSDDELPGLLGGAVLVAYPSLGEGFGLPVLEAMACGAPVLTTRFLALPEVGGDVAAYTDPDSSSMATALEALIDDPADRADRSARGIERATDFSWERSAETHVDAFREAAGTTLVAERRRRS